MSICVNGICGREQVAGHDFCPNCGIDNRPITSQWEVGPHPHLFPMSAKFCVKCGVDRQAEMDRLANLKRSKIILGIGAGFLVMAIAFTIIAGAIDNSNYNEFEKIVLKAQAEKRKLDPINGPHFKPSPLGNFVYLFGLVGAGVTIFGGFLFVNNRKPLVNEVGDYTALI